MIDAQDLGRAQATMCRVASGGHTGHTLMTAGEKFPQFPAVGAAHARPSDTSLHVFNGRCWIKLVCAVPDVKLSNKHP